MNDAKYRNEDGTMSVEQAKNTMKDFCTLATKCEGMIKLRDLGSDFYVYDDKKDHIIGENSGEIFKLGDEIKIQVKGVNIEERLIDYVRVIDSK